jgi:hypothetical protein
MFILTTLTVSPAYARTLYENYHDLKRGIQLQQLSVQEADKLISDIIADSATELAGGQLQDVISALYGFPDLLYLANFRLYARAFLLQFTEPQILLEKGEGGERFDWEKRHLFISTSRWVLHSMAAHQDYSTLKQALDNYNIVISDTLNGHSRAFDSSDAIEIKENYAGALAMLGRLDDAIALRLEISKMQMDLPEDQKDSKSYSKNLLNLSELELLAGHVSDAITASEAAMRDIATICRRW